MKTENDESLAARIARLEEQIALQTKLLDLLAKHVGNIQAWIIDVTAATSQRANNSGMN